MMESTRRAVESRVITRKERNREGIPLPYPSFSLSLLRCRSRTVYKSSVRRCPENRIAGRSRSSESSFKSSRLSRALPTSLKVGAALARERVRHVSLQCGAHFSAGPSPSSYSSFRDAPESRVVASTRNSPLRSPYDNDNRDAGASAVRRAPHKPKNNFSARSGRWNTCRTTTRKELTSLKVKRNALLSQWLGEKQEKERKTVRYIVRYALHIRSSILASVIMPSVKARLYIIVLKRGRAAVVSFFLLCFPSISGSSLTVI